MCVCVWWYVAFFRTKCPLLIGCFWTRGFSRSLPCGESGIPGPKIASGLRNLGSNSEWKKHKSNNQADKEIRWEDMSHICHTWKLVKISWLNFGRKIFRNKRLHFNVDRKFTTNMTLYMQTLWISKDVFSHHQLPHRILCHKKNAGDCENHTGDCAKDCAVSTYTWQCQSTANGRCKSCCPPTHAKKCGGKKIATQKPEINESLPETQIFRTW